MTIDISSLLCYKLFLLVKTNEQIIDKQVKQFDLSRTQWKTLVKFNFLPMPCTQQQLLKAMEIDRAHLTRVLDQLEQRKLLMRARLSHDKRSFSVTLTSEGQRLLKKIEKILEHYSTNLVAELSKKDAKTFTNLLHSITSSLLHKLNDKQKD